MFNRLRIGKKLTLCFCMMIAIIMILGGVAFYSFTSVIKSKDHIVVLFNSAGKINHFIDTTNLIRQHLLQFLSSRDQKYTQAFDTEYQNTVKIADEVKANVTLEKNKVASQELIQTLAGIDEMKKAYDAQEKSAVDFTHRLGQTSEQVLESIAKTTQALHETILKTATGDNGEQMVEVVKLELEKELLNCSVLVGKIMVTENHFASAASADEAKAQKQSIADYTESLNDKLTAIKPALPEGEVSQSFDATHSLITEWQKVAQGYVQAIESEKALQGPLLDQLKKLIDQSGVLLANNAEGTKAEGKHQDQLISMSILIIGIATCAAVIIAIVLGVVLTRTIAGGISRIVSIFKRITDDGEIDVQIDESLQVREDEIGDLAKQAAKVIDDYHSVKDAGQSVARGDWTHHVKIKSDKDAMNKNLANMFDEVNDVLSQVQIAVQQVASGATQVASASDNLSQGATESAASLEEITSSMTEMGTQTNQNAHNAVEASDLAKNANKVAGDGQGMMKEMIRSMQQITKNSQDVQKVVKVIDDISFQTNLLALNAAVEAARAGVHGKGFAVVAEEVRNLAARCAKAAGETTQMIENNNRQINDGAQIAEKTANMLDAIVSHVSDTTNLVNEIARASNEQAQGVTQVTQAIQQIDSVTQQNSASAEETASVSSEMSKNTGSLQATMSRFKLRQTKNIGSNRGQSSAVDSISMRQNSGSSRATAVGKYAEKSQGASLKQKRNASTGTGSKQNSANESDDESWGGGNTATAVMSQDNGEPNYNFKLDDSEFGKY